MTTVTGNDESIKHKTEARKIDRFGQAVWYVRAVEMSLDRLNKVHRSGHLSRGSLEKDFCVVYLQRS